jgi:hypothetical protein
MGAEKKVVKEKQIENNMEDEASWYEVDGYLDRDDSELESNQEAQRAVRPRQGLEEIRMFIIRSSPD